MNAEPTMLQSSESPEDVFRTMANSAPVLLWMAGLDALCTFFNQTWLDFTGRSQQQEYGVGWTEGVHPEDYERCMTTYMDAFRERRAFEMVYRLRRHDGAYRWILDRGAPRRGRSGDFAGFIGSCIDITERYDREEQMSTSLREKDLLLAEIHHRVKNNLQVVHSLLELQIGGLSDERIRGVLLESQNRVRAMAQIHQTLYESNNFEKVNIHAFLDALIPTLMQTYGTGSDAIRLHIAAQELALPIGVAVPCGLLFNELVTNALKHGVGTGAGGLWVSLERDGDTHYALAVADDGPGFPAELDLENSASLGLTLVSLLAGQIGGTVDIQRSGPTRVRVRFPAPQERLLA